jgi:hypothetical protein
LVLDTKRIGHSRRGGRILRNGDKQMSKPLKLNCAIAVMKGIKSRSHSVISELYKVIQKPELFDGLSRTHRKIDDLDPDIPSESKVVQFRMKDVLSDVRECKSDLIDAFAQVEIANTQGRAAVWVDGKELLPELPVTVILPLEKELLDIQTFIEAIPVLGSDNKWKTDDNTGLWMTEVLTTHRTKKVPKSHTLADATREHPAQVQLLFEDVIAGYWDLTKFSGAMRKVDKEAILARIEKLKIAVKRAREEANDTPAPQRGSYGAKIFDYLLDGVV